MSMSAIPRDQIEARLAELRRELEQGRAVLADLETKQREITAAMLRITGAAQVLEELLAAAPPALDPPAPPADPPAPSPE